jgi:hypothetical protein
MVYAINKQVIAVGMNFGDAKILLSETNSIEQILQKMPPEPPSKLADYEIPDNRLLEIIYDSGTNKIISLAMAEIPSTKDRRWINIEEINLEKNDLKKYILIADKEAEKTLAEANKTGLGHFLLQDYWVEIHEIDNADQKIVEIKYTSGVPVNFRGHPQHFSVWIYKKTMEVKLFKGS